MRYFSTSKEVLKMLFNERWWLILFVKDGDSFCSYLYFHYICICD